MLLRSQLKLFKSGVNYTLGHRTTVRWTDNMQHTSRVQNPAGTGQWDVVLNVTCLIHPRSKCTRQTPEFKGKWPMDEVTVVHDARGRDDKMQRGR